jgi:hypothetical protein
VAFKLAQDARNAYVQLYESVLKEYGPVDHIQVPDSNPS